MPLGQGPQYTIKRALQNEGAKMPQCQGPQYTGTTKRTPQGERGQKMPFCQGAQYYKKGTTWRRGQVGPYYTTKRALQGEIHVPVRCLSILQNGHYGVSAPTKYFLLLGALVCTRGGIGSGKRQILGHNIKYWGTRSGIGCTRRTPTKDQFK